MPEPLLTQVFGSKAQQTADILTIDKSDLATVGLTPSATNTAESLYIAILLLAQKYLNDTNQQTNPDIQVTISQGFADTLVSRNNQVYRQRTYTVELQKLDNNADIYPNDY